MPIIDVKPKGPINEPSEWTHTVDWSKPVSRMNLDEVKAAIGSLRDRLEKGEITREEFIEERKPLRARFEQLF
jgi:hypothetical protein